MLTLFDDNMPDTEKLSSIVTELFLRGSKFNISLVFISQSYFNVSIRLNATHYFVTKIPNKRELQQIASNHLSGIQVNEALQRLFQRIIFILVKNHITH